MRDTVYIYICIECIEVQELINLDLKSDSMADII